MSIMGMEFQVFGEKPFPFKVFSLLLHIFNAILVIIFLTRLTGDKFISFITAMLFGIHTIQVETIAWLAASFKIETFAFFFLWGLLSYDEYIRHKKIFFYVLTIILFLCSCFSKEQAITFSLALFTLDFWHRRNFRLSGVWAEKIPFLIISCIFGVITLMSSDNIGKDMVIIHFSFMQRLVFAIYALGFYIAKLILPVNLNFLYTYPAEPVIPSYYYLYCIFFFVMVYLLYLFRKNKRVVFGAAFFLINISVTIGTQILAVRPVIAADRYLYLPAIGFFFILAYGFTFLKNYYPKYISSLYGAAILYLLIISGLTFQRSRVYKNSLSLFNDVIDKLEASPNQKAHPLLAVAYLNRGKERKTSGDINGALSDYEKSLKIDKTQPSAYLNIGNIHFANNRDKEALDYYNKSIEYNAESPKAYCNRGALYGRQGKNELALADLNKAIALDPLYLDAYSNRSLVLEQMGDYESDVKDLRIAISLSHQPADLLNSLAYSLMKTGKLDEAISEINKAIKLKPGIGPFYLTRSIILSAMNKIPEAKADAQKSMQLGTKPNPAYLQALGL